MRLLKITIHEHKHLLKLTSSFWW